MDTGDDQGKLIKLMAMTCVTLVNPERLYIKLELLFVPLDVAAVHEKPE